MTTDVAGPIQQASVGRNALLSTAQVNELAKEGSTVQVGVGRRKGSAKLAMISYA